DCVLVTDLDQHLDSRGQLRQLGAGNQSRGKDRVDRGRWGQMPAARVRSVVEREARTVRIAGRDNRKTGIRKPAEAFLESAPERRHPCRSLSVATCLVGGEEDGASVGDEVIEPRPELANPRIR